MQPRSRESCPLLASKQLPAREFLNTPLETWAVVLVLILTMVLGALALGAWWGSLDTDQTIGHHQDRLSTDFVC